MVNKPYQLKPDKSISEKFMARAREKRRKGEEFQHWVRAAEIARRIEAGQPVGHHRRKRRKRTSKTLEVSHV